MGLMAHNPIGKRNHARQYTLPALIAALHRHLGVVFHTATGLELGAISEAPLPPKPTHAAVVRDVGSRVDRFVRSAVVENAWRILHYRNLRSLLAEGPTGDDGGMGVMGEAAAKRLGRDFHFGTPAAEVLQRYRLPDLKEPLRLYDDYLGSLQRDRWGAVTVRRIPTAICPRPYPEALATIGSHAQEALRLAGELSPRIADVYRLGPVRRATIQAGDGPRSRSSAAPSG